MLAVLLSMVAVMIVVPFGRRDDWLGWLAMTTLIGANVVLWGLLVWGVVRSWRDPRQ